MASTILTPIAFGRNEWKTAETTVKIASTAVAAKNIILVTVEQVEAGTIPKTITITRVVGTEFGVNGGEEKPSKNVFVNWVIFSEEEV